MLEPSFVLRFWSTGVVILMVRQKANMKCVCFRYAWRWLYMFLYNFVYGVKDPTHTLLSCLSTQNPEILEAFQTESSWLRAALPTPY